MQVRLHPSATGFTGSQGRRRAQRSYSIDRVELSGRCCNMRAHHNGSALDGHRREVEFGYSRESAWLLTETTITWQGRTEAWVECASRTCTASTIQSHREPPSGSLSNPHTCCSHRPAALPKKTLLLYWISARGDSDSQDTTQPDGETVTTPADFVTRLPDLHSVHIVHNHLTYTPWPVDRRICWILRLGAAALHHHRRP
jgi:hypothetical protein